MLKLRHSPAADTGGSLPGVHHLQQTRLHLFAEPPHAAAVVRPHRNTTCDAQTNPERQQQRLGKIDVDVALTVQLCLALTFVEVRRGADLPDGGFQLHAEGVAAAGVHARGKTLLVLQLHSVKV